MALFLILFLCARKTVSLLGFLVFGFYAAPLKITNETVRNLNLENAHNKSVVFTNNTQQRLFLFIK